MNIQPYTTFTVNLASSKKLQQADGFVPVIYAGLSANVRTIFEVKHKTVRCIDLNIDAIGHYHINILHNHIN